jgi:signal transduction histidine kinase/DNA-binding NarL/FixJ family response regulator
MNKKIGMILRVLAVLSISVLLTVILAFFRIMNRDTFIFNAVFVSIISLVILFFFETQRSQTADLDIQNRANAKRLKDVEKTADDLLKERMLLEEKVRERTSDLEKANRKLKEMDAIKTNFFTNISHEIRTPLTLLLSPLESVINGAYGEKIDRNNKILKVMKSNGLHLLKLINNLLDFTRIETGRMTVRKEAVDAARLVGFYVESIRQAAESRDLSLKYSCYEDGIPALIDKNLFEVVFFNLVSNAFKFTPNSGTITVILERKGGNLVLEIRDTGVGIPKEKHDLIFDRFTQAFDDAKGAGLGLSLVRDIVSLLNGNIAVESEVERGSSFTVTLPLGDCENTEPMKNFEKIDEYILHDLVTQNEKICPDGLQEKSKRSILIVEDNSNMRDFLSEVLKDEYNVITADDGYVALQKLEGCETGMDLIISDVMMPNLDGKDFFNMIKNDDKYKDIPFIFLTAKASFEDKIDGLKEGAIDYIYKPFSIEELIARVESIINKKERIKESYKREIRNSIMDFFDSGKKMQNTNDDSVIFARFNITPREGEIIKLILKGEENKGIGDILNISVNTVNNHIQNIYRKLNIQNRVELINLFRN